MYGPIGGFICQSSHLYFSNNSVVPEKSDKVDNAPDQSGFSFMKRTPWEIEYNDDIYVGYRYYNTFKIEAKDFASFDEATSSWVAEAGDYSLKIGVSSADIKQTAAFKIAKDMDAGKVSKTLVPSVEIETLVKN